jgi:hypothetical protein
MSPTTLSRRDPMTADVVYVYKTKGRYRSMSYVSNGEKGFCVAEQTRKGALVTEFNEHGVAVNQVYHKDVEAESLLKDYLKHVGSVEIRAGDYYERVYSNSACNQCGGRVVRELDLKEPESIAEVPVVPIFVCTECSKKYYSMSKSYLRHLVNENQDLFEKRDLEEKEKDIDAFINTLNEYIVRVFASKKISKLD